MKSSSYILRGLQILSGLMGLAIIILLLSLFGIISGSDDQRPTAENPPTQKVARPIKSGGADYQTLMQSGDDAIIRGSREMALSYYQQASQLEANLAAPYEKIGDLSFLERDYEEALRNFELALNLAPQSTTLPLKVAHGLMINRKPVEAETKLNEIKEENQTMLYYQGSLAAFLNEPDRAKELLQKSIEISSDELLKTYAQKILTTYQIYDTARDAPLEYLQILLAGGFDENNESGLAIELAFAALKKNADYRDGWVVLAHSFLQQKKWNDAIDACTKAIQLDAENAACYFFRAIGEEQIAKYEFALADFEQAAKLGYEPKILIKQHLADLYFAENDLEKAYPLYKETVLADPSDLERFIRPMALAINQLNKPKDADELAARAAESKPGSAMAENLLGWAALANNRMTEARDHFDKALQKDPKLDAAYLNLGQWYERQGKTPEALKNYAEALRLGQEFGNTTISETAKSRYDRLQEEGGLPVQGDSGASAPSLL